MNYELSKIESGALQTLFDRALEKVLANILDPNTDDSKRGITIKFEIKPIGSGGVALGYQVKTNLLPEKSRAVTLMYGQDNGEIQVGEIPKGTISCQVIFNDTNDEDPSDAVEKPTNIRTIGGKNNA